MLLPRQPRPLDEDIEQRAVGQREQLVLLRLVAVAVDRGRLRPGGPRPLSAMCR